MNAGRLRRVANPPNPWERTRVEWLGPAPELAVEVSEEHPRSMLSRNDSPDIPFRYSVNAYRGCQHACAYCYARPTHERLGFGAGTDFDTRIVVKRDAPEVLRAEFAKRSWRREVVAISGNTDPYQPLEASYELTRGLLQACLDFRTPVAVITKAALVRRDLDLLTRLAEGPGAVVHVSIPFRDPDLARALEPGAPTPAKRFETMAALSEAGVPTGLSLSPLIPGLDEGAIPELVERAAAAGAGDVFATLLRLPGSVEAVFFERLTAALPGRAKAVRSALEELRAGQLQESRFGNRMAGLGPRWQALEDLLKISARRHGLGLGEASRPRLPDAPPPPTQIQAGLFDDLS